MGYPRASGLGCSPFARHYLGNHVPKVKDFQVLFSLPRSTEMFQFSRLPPIGYDLHRAVTGVNPPGCPIRRSPDLSLLAAPRSISSLATSFIGYCPQSILRVPFLAPSSATPRPRKDKLTYTQARSWLHFPCILYVVIKLPDRSRDQSLKLKQIAL